MRLTKKNKKFGLIAVAVALGGYFLIKRNILTGGTLGGMLGGVTADPMKKAAVLAWANSDGNPTSRSVRVAGVNELDAAGIDKLYLLITDYFSTNSFVPEDLQGFWDAHPKLAGV